MLITSPYFFFYSFFRIGLLIKKYLRMFSIDCVSFIMIRSYYDIAQSKDNGSLLKFCLFLHMALQHKFRVFLALLCKEAFKSTLWLSLLIILRERILNQDVPRNSHNIAKFCYNENTRFWSVTYSFVWLSLVLVILRLTVLG